MAELVTIEDIVNHFSELLPSLHSVLWGLFALILFYTAIHAIVFVYHWSKYNIAPGPFLQMTYLVYFSGIGVFAGIMFLALIAILT